MIILLDTKATQEEINSLIKFISSLNIEISLTKGNNFLFLELSGDTSAINIVDINSLDFVISATNVKTQSKQKDFISVNITNNTKIGNKNFAIITTLSLEDKQRILYTANELKNSGASVLNANIYSDATLPNTNYIKKLNILNKIKKEINIPVTCEINDIKHINNFCDIDLIQIGNNNIKNYTLLKEIARSKKTIMLKKDFTSSIEEFLLSAEYILNEGNENIILCLQGTKTINAHIGFEISEIPLLKSLSFLPVIADTSNSICSQNIVEPLSFSATAAGADGLILNTHIDNTENYTNINQSIALSKFKILSKRISTIYSYSYRPK